jgi:hypothetical protein
MQLNAGKSMIREFRLVPSGAGQGVSCDANGAFVGAVPLLKQSRDECRWEPRNCEQLSKQLGADFGLPIDMSSKIGGLRAICNALNDGDLARAQIATVLLAIPDPPPLVKSTRSRKDVIKFIRDLDWSGMIKADWDSDEHPRWSAGAPDSQGGRFAARGEAPGDAFVIVRGRSQNGDQNDPLVQVSMSARGTPPRRPNRETEEACERQLDSDMYVCGSLRDKQERAICRSSAMARYAACLKGDPMPPLTLPEPDNKSPPPPTPAYHLPYRPPWWLPFIFLPALGGIPA